MNCNCLISSEEFRLQMRENPNFGYDAGLTSEDWWDKVSELCRFLSFEIRCDL